MYEMYFEFIEYNGSENENIHRELVYASGSHSDKYKISSPKFSQDLGQAGELSFMLYPNDNLWRSDAGGVDFTLETRYSKLTTFVYLYRDGDCFWRGRILNDSKDFFGQKSIVCEGQLAFLHDVNAREYSFGFGVDKKDGLDIRHESSGLKPRALLQRFLDMYNENSTPYKDIMLGDVTFSEPNSLVYAESDDFDTVLDAMLSIFSNDGYFSIHYVDAKNTNGYVYSSRAFLDYNKYNDRTKLSTQGIRFGENLLDLTEKIDASNIYTVIIPLGKNTTNYICKKCERVVNVFNDREKNTVLWEHLITHGDEVTEGLTSPTDEKISEWFPHSDQGPRLTIESVNRVNGRSYCYYPTSNTFSNDALLQTYGWIERVVMFDDIDDPSELLTAAIRERSLINMIDTLEIKAFDLKLAGYNVDSINLGDMIQIDSNVHGVYKLLQCTRIELDLEDPTNNVYYFGSKIEGLTDSQILAKKEANKNAKKISYLSYKIGLIK